MWNKGEIAFEEMDRSCFNNEWCNNRIDLVASGTLFLRNDGGGENLYYKSKSMVILLIGELGLLNGDELLEVVEEKRELREPKNAGQ